MTRPTHLPDFRSPPLNEVVLGVQFNAPDGYQQIFAHEVWTLFRERFPLVQEHQAIPPQFEIVGVPTGPQINFGLVSGAIHDRFWFLTPNGDQLIQFQNDRLLHNWRKVAGVEDPYPRYENMVISFEKECSSLFSYFKTTFGALPEINQCEISYLNAIPIGPGERFEDWLTIVAPSVLAPDDFGTTWRKAIVDETGVPQGRITIEANVGYSPNGEKAILLNLTARGKPQSGSLTSALAFLSKSREMIVSLFADVTTESAHKRWERA